MKGARYIDLYDGYDDAATVRYPSDDEIEELPHDEDDSSEEDEDDLMPEREDPEEEETKASALI